MDWNGRFCASVWVWSGNQSLRVIWNNRFTVRLAPYVTGGALKNVLEGCSLCVSGGCLAGPAVGEKKLDVKQAEQIQTKPMKAKWTPWALTGTYVSLTISVLTVQVTCSRGWRPWPWTCTHVSAPGYGEAAPGFREAEGEDPSWC